MWVPALPAGCGPAKVSSRIWPPLKEGSLDSGERHTQTGPLVKRESTVKPLRKASSYLPIITSGLAANGLVSMAVTKIEFGCESRAGTLPKGRVRMVVHCPESTNCCTMASRDKLTNSPAL